MEMAHSRHILHSNHTCQLPRNSHAVTVIGSAAPPKYRP
jgi:hypothetical protein